MSKNRIENILKKEGINDIWEAKSVLEMADDLIMDEEFCRSNRINPLKPTSCQKIYALKFAIAEYKEIKNELKINPPYKSNYNFNEKI